MADPQREVFKYESLDTRVTKNENGTITTQSMSANIREALSGLKSRWFSKERRLKNEYLKAEKNLTKVMNTPREVNSKEDMLAMNKEIAEAYRKAFDATLKMAQQLKKSNDPRRQDITGQMGRQLTQMQTNRGHLTSMMQKGIMDFDKPGKQGELKTLFSNSPETFFKQSEITKFSNMTAFDAGAMNTVYKTKENEKDVIVKPGNMFLRHEKEFDDKDKVSRSIYINKDTSPEFAKIAYWSQHDKIGYDGKEDLFSVDKPLFKNKYNKETDQIERTLVVESEQKRTIETAFRDQGTYAVSQLLGFDVIVPTVLGVDENNRYVSTMDMADGIAAFKYNGYLTDTYKNEVVKNIDSTINFTPETKAKEKDRLLDMKDPSLQRELSKLAIVDIICGQEDRHTGNFFISGNPGNYKVTGIDNDYSFGMGKSPATKEESRQFEKDEIAYAKGKGTAFGNNPTHIYTALPVVSQDIKDAVMKIKPEDLRNVLKGTVDMGDKGSERIEAAVKRLEAVQNHLKQCKVIPKGKDYNEHTAQLLLPPVDTLAKPNPLLRDVGKMVDYEHPAMEGTKESSPMYTLYHAIVDDNERFKSDKHVSATQFNDADERIREGNKNMFDAPPSKSKTAPKTPQKPSAKFKK
jgi:hypothetical protein